jgi:hypothetical protein
VSSRASRAAELESGPPRCRHCGKRLRRHTHQYLTEAHATRHEILALYPGWQLLHLARQPDLCTATLWDGASGGRGGKGEACTVRCERILAARARSAERRRQRAAERRRRQQAAQEEAALAESVLDILLRVWQLDEAQARALMGVGEAEETAGTRRDRLRRLHAIHAGLLALLGGPEGCAAWLRRDGNAFGGPALERMLAGGMAGLAAVQAYLQDD